MNAELSQKLISGAITGLIGAIVTDMDAYRKNVAGAPFDLNLALLRWIVGAVMGAATAAGISLGTAQVL
jgi:hypothetical protein